MKVGCLSGASMPRQGMQWGCKSFLSARSRPGLLVRAISMGGWRAFPTVWKRLRPHAYPRAARDPCGCTQCQFKPHCRVMFGYSQSPGCPPRLAASETDINLQDAIELAARTLAEFKPLAGAHQLQQALMNLRKAAPKGRTSFQRSYKAACSRVTQGAMYLGN